METYLQELKRRLHILHDDDDDNLRSLIEIAHAKVKHWCGDFDLTDPVGRDLVFEQVRFIYHGKTELFYTLFASDLSQYGFTLATKE